jgi:hypothetical protein
MRIVVASSNYLQIPMAVCKGYALGDVNDLQRQHFNPAASLIRSARLEPSNGRHWSIRNPLKPVHPKRNAL